MAKYSSQEIKDLILELRTDNINSQRNKAFQALVEAGETALPDLIMALKSDDAIIRKCAAVSLGKIGSKAAFEPLLEALKKEKETETKSRIIEVLGHCIKDRRITDFLIELLLNDPEVDIREAAADALGGLGDPQALVALEYPMLHDNDKSEIFSVASEAEMAITRIRKNLEGLEQF